ncbi:MAG: FAD-dependent oxidoreductase [Bacteroidales bacterium]|nr:MAG: FAD-dependent oxidoreductase [Bacteroidales bacterium]
MFLKRIRESLFKKYILVCNALLIISICSCDLPTQYDVIVYGGTSGGVIAAVSASRLGNSVLLISPGYHLGGLTSNGLGATDIGNKAAIGGMAREFYARIFKYYNNGDSGTQWRFEPHVAETVFLETIREAEVPVVYGERLKLDNGVVKSGAVIEEIEMESGIRYKAKVFIDATYEGDLMAVAGISYTCGREGNDKYKETLNGVQTSNAVHHQFIEKIDPYIVPGDSSSGLLHGIQEEGPGPEGSSDHRIQAYCFRLCTTDSAENRRPWPKPEEYDESKYQLLIRNFEAGDHRIPWSKILMPNRKTDCNNNFAVSTDYIGMNYSYPDGNYTQREEIFKMHESYQKGLMWTLANHPRVPEHIREHFSTWGLASDEFADNDNWPRELYIREARRMIGEYVMTQHNCQGRQVATDAAGLAAYTMDSHHVQRYVDSLGFVRNEGDVQVGGFDPYPVSYRSIVPKQEECTNLFVPFCLSASHIAFGSIRMEPVFMVLSETASIAASMAIERKTDVQAINYNELRGKLIEAGQILEWKR